MTDADEAKSETPEGEEASTQEFDKLPSSLPNFGIDLLGFASESDAQAVAKAIEDYLFVIGKILNLHRISRVIVSYDYAGALASLDRGVKTSGILKPTHDEVAVGIAMAVAIVENGEMRSVMVLDAHHMIVFAHPDNLELEPLREEMAYSLAHECGHIHDLDVHVCAFPDFILKAVLSYRDGILFDIASGCWNEYIACRLSAFAAKVGQINAYEDMLCEAILRAKDRADAAIRQYRMHGDIRRVCQEVSEEYRRVMVHASYLIGHIDGLRGSAQDLAPKAIELIERTPYFKPLFPRLQEKLRSMYETYGKWETIAVYEPLKLLAYELLKICGIDIQDRGEQAYVDIPKRPETLPSLQEQIEFRLSMATHKS